MLNRIVKVPVKWSRRMPDPNFDGAHTHFMLVPAKRLPMDIPLDPNPREQNINRPIYRTVGRSLSQEGETIPGSFHLKHRGLTLIASKVTKAPSTHPGLDVLELHFPEGNYGIVDGGHSYEIVRKAQGENSIPDNEYIKLEVITGLAREQLVTDIAGGRNTSIQVHAKSLLDLNKQFEFLKVELAMDGWTDRISWHENEDGMIDVVDVIAILSCFDIASYPDRHNHPVDAYRRKRSMLDRFEKHPERYRRLIPIVRDVLQLHDWIQYDSERRWQEVGGASGAGGRYGRLEMVETKRNGRPNFEFPFLPNGLDSEKRLRRPAVLPILATFRLFVVDDNSIATNGDLQPVRWRNGFDEVLELWTEAGGPLLQAFYEHFNTTGRDLHASGRSPALWGSLYKELALIDAERRSAL